MTAPAKRYTAEAFDAFVVQPENEEKLFEFIGGEIVEVPSNPYSSEIASEISFFIKLFLRESGIEGHVTGEQGGYQVGEERYAPDVAYLSTAVQPQLARTGYNPNPPQLAVEVVSPTDSERNLMLKMGNYLAAGTVVWIVYPDEQEVHVYRPGQAVQVLTVKDTLDGGDVLPGFMLAVEKIFPAKE